MYYNTSISSTSYLYNPSPLAFNIIKAKNKVLAPPVSCRLQHNTLFIAQHFFYSTTLYLLHNTLFIAQHFIYSTTLFLQCNTLFIAQHFIYSTTLYLQHNTLFIAQHFIYSPTLYSTTLYSRATAYKPMFYTVTLDLSCFNC